MACLLQEIISIYPLLSPPKLKNHSSNRVCNALALLQCIASHPETRRFFVEAKIPLFLYPFLNTSSKAKTFEYLRLTSLGVIGALIKSEDPGVVAFLLGTEIFPLCLRIMEIGTELSRTVATFIIQRILSDETGLHKYVCGDNVKFGQLANSLYAMTNGISDGTASRLLRHIVRCYCHLAENPRAKAFLQTPGAIPTAFLDGTTGRAYSSDLYIKKWLPTLLSALGLNNALSNFNAAVQSSHLQGQIPPQVQNVQPREVNMGMMMGMGVGLNSQR